MAHLEPVTIGDLTFHDFRHPDKPYNVRVAVRVNARVLAGLMDRKQELLGGVDPGGREVRGNTAQIGYVKYKREGGLDRFETWKAELEADRTEDDCAGLTESFIWIVVRDGEPQGSVGMYCIELLGETDRVVSYRAMPAPITRRLLDTSEFMAVALDGPMQGTTDAGETKNFQLVRWRFPVLDRVNRWGAENGDGTILVRGLSDRHELVMIERDGVRFPSAYNRIAPSRGRP